eukprot:gene2611-30934_t
MNGILVPEDSFYNTNPFSSQILECPNDNSCTYPNRTQHLQAYQSTLLASPELYNRTEYNVLLCAEGYTGPKCASCTLGYGYVDVAECKKCLFDETVNAVLYCLIICITLVPLVLTLRAGIRATAAALWECELEEMEAAGVPLSGNTDPDHLVAADEQERPSARRREWQGFPAAPSASSLGATQGGAHAKGSGTTAEEEHSLGGTQGGAHAKGSGTTAEEEHTSSLGATQGGLHAKGSGTTADEEQKVLLLMKWITAGSDAWESLLYSAQNVIGIPRSTISLACSMDEGNIERMIKVIVLSTIICIFFYYPSLVEYFFTIFMCDKVDVELEVEDEGYNLTKAYGLDLGLRWAKDYRTVCYEGQHAVLAYALGIPGVVLVAAFCPIATAWGLASNVDQLKERHFIADIPSAGAACLTAHGAQYSKCRRSVPDRARRTVFQYAEYTEHCYAWESVIMLRKLFLSIVLIFLSGLAYPDGVQVLLALWVIFVTLTAHLLYHPFKSSFVSNLETLSQLTTMSTLYISYPEDNAAKNVLIIIMFGINICTIAVFLLCLLIKMLDGMLLSAGFDLQGDSGVAMDIHDLTFALEMKFCSCFQWLAYPAAKLLLKAHEARIKSGRVANSLNSNIGKSVKVIKNSIMKRTTTSSSTNFGARSSRSSMSARTTSSSAAFNRYMSRNSRTSRSSISSMRQQLELDMGDGSTNRQQSGEMGCEQRLELDMVSLGDGGTNRQQFGEIGSERDSRGWSDRDSRESRGSRASSSKRFSPKGLAALSPTHPRVSPQRPPYTSGGSTEGREDNPSMVQLPNSHIVSRPLLLAIPPKFNLAIGMGTDFQGNAAYDTGFGEGELNPMSYGSPALESIVEADQEIQTPTAGSMRARSSSVPSFTMDQGIGSPAPKEGNRHGSPVVERPSRSNARSQKTSPQPPPHSSVCTRESPALRTCVGTSTGNEGEGEGALQGPKVAIQLD